MNIKAERIEQLIQLVNRNLQLICSGQADGITPLEWNRLQKVDAIIFGHDKFAYEMVHFVAASSDKEGQQSKSRDLFSVWEENFVRGLESLLVECAVIHDDIERDCFVSRVYCWFSEKLLERRDVPRAESVRTMDLRNSVVQFAGEDSHLTRALDNYSGGPLSPHRTYLQNSFDASAMPIDPLDAKDNHMSDEPIHLPPIVNKGQTIASRMPLYVKHSQPAILRSQSLAKLIAQAPILPKTPGADDNYGLLYSQPETEAEKNMNELWLARRRQEAFQYKTQQQLAVVMDRLALHKARMESDSLRRQETTGALRAGQSGGGVRPFSAGDAHSRPQSSGRAGIFTRLRGVNLGRKRDESPSSSPEREVAAEDKLTMSRLNDTAVPGSAVSVTMSGTNGADKEVQVVAASRSSILRPENSSSRREILPMRFRTSLPAGYSVDRQKFYLREADDSDEENEPLTPAIRSSKNGAPSGTKKKASAPAGRTEVLFKHEKPVMRERPHSARLFRQIAQDDPEFKVMYRNCNYRRMELTEDQEKWLEDREIERKQRSDTVARQLVAEVQARAEKKKNKDKDKAKDKGDKGKDKGDKGKGKKKDSGSKDATKDAPKAKYKSATHFMSRHFPQFEETAESTEDGHGLAPMRLLQLEEVAEVEATFQRYGLPIREAVLRKALVVPQDKPEAICLEGLREGAEGLMVNPLPPHLWRRLAAGKKGKKKRKGKK